MERPRLGNWGKKEKEKINEIIKYFVDILGIPCRLNYPEEFVNKLRRPHYSRSHGYIFPGGIGVENGTGPIIRICHLCIEPIVFRSGCTERVFLIVDEVDPTRWTIKYLSQPFRGRVPFLWNVTVSR